MRHHVDGVQDPGRLGLGDFFHHLVRNLVGAGRPDVDDLIVLLALGDETVLILLLVFLDAVFRGIDKRLLGLGDDEVIFTERNTGLAGIAEAQSHHPVAEDDRALLTAIAVDDVDDRRNFFLRQDAVDERERNAVMTRQNFGQKHAARRRFDDLGHGYAFFIDRPVACLDLGVQIDALAEKRVLDFADVTKNRPFPFHAIKGQGEVIDAKNDVLRRNDDGLAVRRAQDVVRRHHENTSFKLRFDRQRHVYRHLVAVEVGVERGADQRMKLDRLAFNQDGFKRLNAKTVQRRRAVQKNRVLADNFLENVPHFGAFFFNHALGGLDRGREAIEFKLVVDERLEELERHFLRQTALVQFQFGADDDNRTARVIDTLAEQVLAEAALFALEHVGERLERALVRASNDAAAAAIVEKGIDRFLQHAFFVAHDDVGRLDFHQLTQTVVAVDDAAVKIVEIRGREAAAVERNKRAQFRRNDRNDIKDHPFRTRA